MKKEIGVFLYTADKSPSATSCHVVANISTTVLNTYPQNLRVGSSWIHKMEGYYCMSEADLSVYQVGGRATRLVFGGALGSLFQSYFRHFFQNDKPVSTI